MADCARLESVCAFTGTVGSNPTLSATPLITGGEARQATPQPGRGPLEEPQLVQGLLRHDEAGTRTDCTTVRGDGSGPTRWRRSEPGQAGNGAALRSSRQARGARALRRARLSFSRGAMHPGTIVLPVVMGEAGCSSSPALSPAASGAIGHGRLRASAPALIDEGPHSDRLSFGLTPIRARCHRSQRSSKPAVVRVGAPRHRSAWRPSRRADPQADPAAVSLAAGKGPDPRGGKHWTRSAGPVAPNP